MKPDYPEDIAHKLGLAKFLALRAEKLLEEVYTDLELAEDDNERDDLLEYVFGGLEDL